MYKRDQHYNEKISKADLEIEISKHYKNEHGLIIQLMSNCVQDDLIETRHELSCANEELWSLNDWPEGEGFGSSDRHSYIDRVKESIAFERKSYKQKQNWYQSTDWNSLQRMMMLDLT